LTSVGFGYDDHGAVRVVQALLAHRAEQHAGEAASPATADDEKAGALCQRKETGCRCALDRNELHCFWPFG
jgi:hypothetical protein